MCGNNLCSFLIIGCDRSNIQNHVHFFQLWTSNLFDPPSKKNQQKNVNIPLFCHKFEAGNPKPISAVLLEINKKEKLLGGKS